MMKLNILLISLLILFAGTQTTYADGTSVKRVAPTHQIILGSGGYMGELQVGYGYKNFSFIYGNTSGLSQLTVRYDQPLFTYFTVGVFGTYALNRGHFLRSPSKYPSKSYYEETAFRGGLSIGVKYKYLYINTNIMDNSLRLLAREDQNRKKWYSSYHWSIGATIRIPISDIRSGFNKLQDMQNR